LLQFAIAEIMSQQVYYIFFSVKQVTVLRRRRKQLGMGDTQNVIHDIYRKKVSRYREYRDTGFAIAVT